MKRNDPVIYKRSSPDGRPFQLRMTAIVRHVNRDGTYSIEAEHVLDSSGKPVGPNLHIRTRATEEQLEAAS